MVKGYGRFPGSIPVIIPPRRRVMIPVSNHWMTVSTTVSVLDNDMRLDVHRLGDIDRLL